MKEHLHHDLRVFSLVALVFFMAAFLVVYRKPRFVILPILSCALPVIIVVGAMSALGVRVTLMTANLPLLLFTLMLPYAVYLIERYRERRAERPDEPGAESTVRSASLVWIPCLFSCMTTMAGFASLILSDSQPIYHLGLYMLLGMAAGLGIVFLGMPSMSRPLPPLQVDEAATRSREGPLVRAFERITLRAPGLVVVLAACLLGVAIWGASRVTAQSKFTSYFLPSSEVYQGLEYIDNEMGGTVPLEIILTSDEAGFFLRPEGLAALEAVQSYFAGVPETGNVRSIATLVDELEKKNENVVALLPLFARHPMVREITREFADEEYSVSRVLVRLRETAPTLDRRAVLDGLRAHLDSQSALEGLEVRETGVFLLYANMLDSLLELQRSTFLYVALAVLLMLFVLFRSLSLAALVLLPQLLPALVTVGAMGWFGVPLDLITVVVASIAMGVGIDAAIQYTVRYRSELARCGDRRAAISRAHATIGRAIWIATSVIVAGFCTLVLSDFRPSIWFGLFTAVAMLISQIAALTVLPSLFLLTGLPRPPRDAEA
jgi:predicted RND superfamily exporter protein